MRLYSVSDMARQRVTFVATVRIKPQIIGNTKRIYVTGLTNAVQHSVSRWRHQGDLEFKSGRTSRVCYFTILAADDKICIAAA